MSQALYVELDITWMRPRADVFSKIADDLTHSDFKLVTGAIRNREVQKNQKLEFELADSGFPLHYIMGVTTKNFRPIGQLEGLPLAPPSPPISTLTLKILKVKS